MATTLQHNITTALTQDLLTAGNNVSSAKYISFSNVGDVNAYVDIILNKGDENYYLVKEMLVAVGELTTLNKDDNIGFDNSINGFSLRIQADDGQSASGAVSVDVIITR